MNNPLIFVCENCNKFLSYKNVQVCKSCGAKNHWKVLGWQPSVRQKAKDEHMSMIFFLPRLKFDL